MKLICDNCRRTFAEAELAHVFPDIPDLLERIGPGEPVPIGECPDCGALVHIEKDDHPSGMKAHVVFTEEMIQIHDNEGEVVSWHIEEWVEDPTAVFSIANVVRMAASGGDVRAIIEKGAKTKS